MDINGWGSPLTLMGGAGNLGNSFIVVRRGSEMESDYDAEQQSTLYSYDNGIQQPSIQSAYIENYLIQQQLAQYAATVDQGKRKSFLNLLV